MIKSDSRRKTKDHPGPAGFDSISGLQLKNQITKNTRLVGPFRFIPNANLGETD